MCECKRREIEREYIVVSRKIIPLHGIVCSGVEALLW